MFVMNRLAVSFVFRDLSLTNDDTLANLQAVLDARNVHAAYAPDDMRIASVGAGARADIADWIAAGHELLAATAPNDSLATTTPYQMRYTGAGAGPELVIAADGNTWTVNVDGGPVASYDTTPVTGADHKSGTPTIGGGPVYKIHNEVADFEFQYKAPVSGGFDDAFCASFEPGTYDLSGGAWVNLPFNEQRRYEQEIGIAQAVAESLFGTTRVYETFWCFGGATIPESLVDYCASIGIDAVIRHATAGTNQTMNTVVPTEMQKTVQAGNAATEFKGVDYDLLDAAGKEARIRANVLTMAITGLAIGGYYILEFPHSGDDVFTAEEIGWMVSAFQLSGCEIVSPLEARAMIGNFTATSDSYAWRSKGRKNRRYHRH